MSIVQDINFLLMRKDATATQISNVAREIGAFDQVIFKIQLFVYLTGYVLILNSLLFLMIIITVAY